MGKKVAISLFLVSIIGVSSILGILFFKSVDPYDVVYAFSKGETNLIIGDEPIEIENRLIIEENKMLVPVEIIQRYINSDIEISDKYNRMYINTENLEFTLENEELDNRVKEGVRLNFLLENIDDTKYLNISGMEKILGIDVNYIEDTDILIIDKMKDAEQIGKIKRNTYLRPKKSSLAYKMDKLLKKENVVIISKSGRWLKVRTEEGFIGYVLEKYVTIEKVEYEIDRKLNNVREDWEAPDKINLVWNYVNKYSPDLTEEETIEGLDVISPTWFSIVSGNGYIVSNGDTKYVKDAHDKGYKIWALINNSFDKDLTKELLADEEAQENVINQILVYSSLYNLDGINIDFENVYYADKDRLTNFMDKLTKELKKQNIIVSMDMTVPSSSEVWSKFYDREKLGEIMDYCMVMTYDEHWASSPKSGSVASIDWVQRGIEKTLKYIPREKLLMGMPFYTRQWEETKEANGKIKVRSKAKSMKSVNEIIEENNLEVVWLEDIGQHYTEYTKDNKRYRIWIEDDKSISLKVELANEYNLAGVASWRKGFEEENIWAVINEVVKENEQKVAQQE